MSGADAVPEGDYRCLVCGDLVRSFSHDPYRGYCNACFWEQLTPEQQKARIEAGGYELSGPQPDGNWARFSRREREPVLPPPPIPGQAPACEAGCLDLGLSECMCAFLATVEA